MDFLFGPYRVNRSTVCFLLALSQASPAAALGLGSIDVRSTLARPLDAVVALLGAPAELNADCFRLAPAREAIGDPPHARLSLEREGDTTRLRLRTQRPVNDPVVQFTLLAECGDRLSREYAILLDPPAPQPEVAVTPPPAAVPDAEGAAPPPSVAQTAAARTDGRPPAPAARQAATAARTHARASAPKKAADAPRLILSGRHRPGIASAAGLPLKLDLNLPDPTRAPERLNADELSDENTALTRKLAHLEMQLVALQKRNAELEARRVDIPSAAPSATTAPAAAPAAPTRAAWRWPYAVLVAVLAGVVALVLSMRRRTRRSSAYPLQETLDPMPADDMSAPGRIPAGRTHSGAAPALHIADIPPPAAEPAGTEVKEDILDQAEVFMAHGHGDLAVHLLQEHLREAPTESPVPWLLLLDLLHRSGDTEGYAAASTECRRYFNVNPSAHPVSQDGEPPGSGIEAYPHVLEQLVHVWNTPAASAFFDDLVYDKRGGTRMGFEPGAYRDILLLRDIAREALPLAA